MAPYIWVASHCPQITFRTKVSFFNSRLKNHGQSSGSNIRNIQGIVTNKRAFVRLTLDAGGDLTA